MTKLVWRLLYMERSQKQSRKIIAFLLHLILYYPYEERKQVGWHTTTYLKLTFVIFSPFFEPFYQFEQTRKSAASHHHEAEKTQHMLYFYRTQVSLGSDLWLRLSLSDLTETLADEDTNSMLNYYANRTIQGSVAIQVTQPGGQLCKQCKWCHLMTKF